MNSTRFEHSMGVMHRAGKVAAHLELEDDFSHTSDHLLFRFGFDHEENSSRIILNTGISDILNEYGIMYSKISDLVTGKGNLSKIISSEIDVDKMDYLNRDSYYACAAYGVIDVERIIHKLKLTKTEIIIASKNKERYDVSHVRNNFDND